MPMTPERWERVKNLYDATQARPQAERAAFLASATAGDRRTAAGRRKPPQPATRHGGAGGTRRNRPPGTPGPAEPHRAAPGKFRDQRTPGSRRHGRGVPRARHQAGSRRRHQGVAPRVHRRPGPACEIRARGARGRVAESSAHCRHPRRRRERRRQGIGAGAGRGRNTGRAAGAAFGTGAVRTPFAGGARLRAADRRCAGGGARKRHHPPGP